MPKILVTVTQEYDVPEGTEVVLAPTGVVSGLRLPSGNFLKHHIAVEHFEGANDDEDACGDLDEIELNNMDVLTLDGDRVVDVLSGEVHTDDTRVLGS
ncbi:hypothetical protein [Sphingosinicella sp. BN140058]|uniref:hypothetical protein n=1 Tax=Sphingosinicella sp. BN140058 TaxID=1892855 RepID=UPI001010C8FD|nr:hypothetical protein [Sphingosinicella sp. BN140058]QAY80440.1 hypothetical protein ETR14_27765 [Sphingosinicella sp. BN140058]